MALNEVEYIVIENQIKLFFSISLVSISYVKGMQVNLFNWQTTGSITGMMIFRPDFPSHFHTQVLLYHLFICFHFLQQWDWIHARMVVLACGKTGHHHPGRLLTDHSGYIERAVAGVPGTAKTSNLLFHCLRVLRALLIDAAVWLVLAEWCSSLIGR